MPCPRGGDERRARDEAGLAEIRDELGYVAQQRPWTGIHGAAYDGVDVISAVAVPHQGAQQHDRDYFKGKDLAEAMPEAPFDEPTPRRSRRRRIGSTRVLVMLEHRLGR
jgi:hypothetical protein